MRMKGLVVVEEQRGCGYRKPAKDGVGVYLVGPELSAPCGRLPFDLVACPVCGGGVHASRGWTWIEPRKLFRLPQQSCDTHPVTDSGLTGAAMGMRCAYCAMGLGMPEGRHGLIWIGEKFYPTPADYLAEARKMGLSRKIKAVPKGFKLGETVVYLAHRFAALKEKLDEHGNSVLDKHGEPLLNGVPGVFATFRPTGIDLVVADADKVPEKAEKLAEQYGARVIQVVRSDQVQPQPDAPLN
jgi:hypothetical protein